MPRMNSPSGPRSGDSMTRLWRSMIRKVTTLHEIVSSIVVRGRGLTHPFRSCRGVFLASLLRHQSNRNPMDMHQRPTIRIAVLACEDPCFHIPPGLVPLVRRMDSGISTMSIRRCEHKCVEYGVCYGYCVGMGRRHLWDTIHSGVARRTEAESEGARFRERKE